MTRLITSLALVTALLAGIASANAAPSHANGLAERAEQGAFSPHGIFDGQ